MAEAILLIRKHTLFPRHTHTHTCVAMEVNDNTCGCVGAVTLKHFKYVRYLFRGELVVFHGFGVDFSQQMFCFSLYIEEKVDRN